MEQIADLDNLRAADKEAQAGKVRRNRHIQRHNLVAEQHLLELRRMILTLDIPEPDYTIEERRSPSGGKVRRIAKLHYWPWLILHRAIFRVVGAELYRSLIADTFACIPGKGLHYGVRRLRTFLRRYPQYKWMYKADYKKFYQSIPHEVAMASIRRKYKDRRFLELLEKAVFNYYSGAELEEILEDEIRRKAGTAHRRLSQPGGRELGSEPHRPPDEGADEGQVLPALLRRHPGPGQDQGGGLGPRQ